jgi:hypothetical protein
MKYVRLVVFGRHHSAEKRGSRYELTQVVGNLKNMASAGVFVRVFCALKHSTSSFSTTPNMILTYIKHKRSRSYQKNDSSKEFHQGRQLVSGPRE